MYRRFGKRILDIIFAGAGLIILSPLFLLLTVLLWFLNKGKPFFYQSRPGLHEVIFTLVKFKTMQDQPDEGGSFLSDEQRTTSLGNFLRRTSLDEIPQLWNVLKGDMSLVGPRPLLTEYLPNYNSEQKQRHNVKPGITGWAQINGRNDISLTEKLRYDVWYVENMSFLLDTKIMFLTVLKVVTQQGIKSSESADAKKFSGK